VHGLDILNYLPIGDYHIIRSPIEPILQDRVTIGNEIIENSDRVYTLLDSEQFQMLIFSSMPKMPADLTQPLIGVPMLHSMGCNGTGKCNAIFFFPFGNPAGTETSSVGDLLLVVPLTGELVVETGGVLIKNRKVDNDRLNRWQRDEAPMLVSRLVLL
jgi:hypothetical protein